LNANGLLCRDGAEGLEPAVKKACSLESRGAANRLGIKLLRHVKEPR